MTDTMEKGNWKKYAVKLTFGIVALQEMGMMTCDIPIGTPNKNLYTFTEDGIDSLLAETRKEERLRIEKKVNEVHKELFDELKDKIEYDAYSDDYRHGILRGYTLIGRYLASLSSEQEGK